MNILFFDTETNGLPKDYKAPMKDVNNWPRVIQLAWEVVNFETQTVVRSNKMLIKPDGWTIPKEKFWIDNGYNTETNEAEGVAMPVVLWHFIEDLNECEALAAHNMAFDYPITGAEMMRYKMSAKPAAREKYCTMQASIELCKIPFAGRYAKKGQYKFPKLEELHNFLFGKGFAGAHDAGNDVAACRAAFFELVKRNKIIIPKTVTT